MEFSQHGIFSTWNFNNLEFSQFRIFSIQNFLNMIFSQHGIFSTYVELSQNVIFSTDNCFITSLNSHHQVKKLQQHTRIHLTCLNFQNMVKNTYEFHTESQNFKNTFTDGKIPTKFFEFPEYGTAGKRGISRILYSHNRKEYHIML